MLSQSINWNQFNYCLLKVIHCQVTEYSNDTGPSLMDLKQLISLPQNMHQVINLMFIHSVALKTRILQIKSLHD